MQRLVEMRHALVGAIDGKTALNQVVGADGQKIGLGREQIGRECGRRHFDHDADLERPGRHSPRLNFLARLGQHAARLAQLLDARHERKHHAQIAVRRGAHQRAQLRAQQLAALQREADRSQAEAAARHLVSARPERVAPMLSAGELIFVDVERPHGHRRGPNIFEQLPVHLVLHVLGQLVRGTSREQQLRSEQPDPFGALRHGERRVAEQIHVRLDADVHAVGGLQRPSGVRS